MEDIIAPSTTSELANIPSNLLGKYSDVAHALALASHKARNGGYDECCFIYVLQLPAQTEWGVIVVPGGEHFPVWRSAILSLRVKSSSCGRVADEHARIEREVKMAVPLFLLNETQGCKLTNKRPQSSVNLWTCLTRRHQRKTNHL